VAVVARFRPCLTAEEQQDRPVFQVLPNSKAVETCDGSHHFEFDQVFAEGASQEAVYDYVGRPIVDGVLRGYNGTIFAYGQTGSGKTHSMMGPCGGSSGQQQHQLAARGIVPRAVQQVFDDIAASSDDSTEFVLRCSFLEVYREQMRDLLNPLNRKLSVKELPQRGLVVHGLSREFVTCPSEALAFLRVGNRARSVGCTHQNQHSSRSHAIFVLHVEQRSLEDAERLGKLTLVDLAGSEKVSKSECVGETLEEAKKINWSLSALGKVIDALVERRPHIPYRDSRLTRVLEEALGGNCRTTLLVAASSCSQHYDETISSLRFASRAKKVQNHARVNYMYSADQLLLLVAQLQRELATAKRTAAASVGRNPTPRQGNIAGRKRRASIDTGHLGRLESSGSEPTLCVSELAGNEKELGKLSSVDEVSKGCEHPAKQAGSPGVETPHGDGDGDGRTPPLSEVRCCDDAESEAPDHLVSDLDGQAWRSLALAAREAILSLERALQLQEVALEEAKVLQASSDEKGGAMTLQTDDCSDAGYPNKGSYGGGTSHPRPHGEQQQVLESNMMSERFRTFQQSVVARSLNWRLQLEQHRTESLKLELAMQKRHNEDMEASLQNPAEHLIGMRQARMQRYAGITRGLGSALRKLPLRQRNGDGGRTQAAIVQAAAVSSSAITPSCQSPAAGMSKSLLQAARTAMLGGPQDPSFPTLRRDRDSLRQGSATSPTKEAASGLACNCGSCDADNIGHCVLPDWVLPAAAKFGEHLAALTLPSGDMGGLEDHQRQRIGSLQSGAGDEEGDEHQDSPAVPTRGQVETLQQSHRLLESHVLQLQQDVVTKDEQLAQLTAEVNAQALRLSALRHEVGVKDTLLERLREQCVRRAEASDRELERLMEQTLVPLLAMLTREQTASPAPMNHQPTLPRTDTPEMRWWSDK